MFRQLGVISRNPLARDRELLARTDRIRDLLRLNSASDRQAQKKDRLPSLCARFAPANDFKQTRLLSRLRCIGKG